MRAPLLLLSPAKSLRFEGALPDAISQSDRTQPIFLRDANHLAADLAKLGKPALKRLMGLSDSLTELNFERYAAFEKQPLRPAIGAFQGQAYQGLDAKTLGSSEIEYLQQSLRILCGLYGVLKPLDEIRAYRLDMGLKFASNGKENLYAFWGERITEALSSEAAKAGCPFILNVASQEYAKSVDLDELGVPVITAAFPGPAVHAKMARGEMGTNGQWAFLPSESNEQVYTFKRNAQPRRAAADEKTTEKTSAPRTGRKRPR